MPKSIARACPVHNQCLCVPEADQARNVRTDAAAGHLHYEVNLGFRINFFVFPVPEADQAGDVGADAAAGHLHDEAGAVLHPLREGLAANGAAALAAARLPEQVPEASAGRIGPDACVIGAAGEA